MTDHSTHDEETTAEGDRGLITIKDLGGNRSPISDLSRRSRLSAHRESDQNECGFADLQGPPTRRTAFRLDVSLKTMVQWLDVPNSGRTVKCLGILSNLSGGGAQLFLRQLPEEGFLKVSLAAPDEFVEERARRSAVTRRGRGSLKSQGRAFFNACEAIRSSLREVEAQVVDIAPHTEDEKGTVYSLSLSFVDRHENLYRLVSFLQRKKVQQNTRASSLNTSSWRSREPNFGAANDRWVPPSRSLAVTL